MRIKEFFKIDFIGIGAAKAGTTWLADNLRNHPQIFIPEKKELIYFNKTMQFGRDIHNYRYEKPVSWYHAFFENAQPDQIKGEISPHYFTSSEAVKKIYQYNPDIKLLVTLRNPVEVAFSSYFFGIQIGEIKPVPFEIAIKKYDRILNSGFYFKFLKRYFERFPSKNIKILLFDVVKEKPEVLYKDVLDFLGLNEYYPDSLRTSSNKTKQNKNQFLNYFITFSRNFIHKHNLHFLIPMLRYSGISPVAEYIRDHLNVVSKGKGARQSLDDDSVRMLQDYYLQDINQLEKLIDMDLSHWKA
ncbi:MAG: sulfotransferase domain-containing protein [Desulfobacteraceae bacterium]|nr:sulfotransferase domain-containing protein [Desulfobacteraceae bacterium]MBC2756847.1 sulfotransferase domain-containing protein [Desulfobacteraceae bacterium]